MIVRNIVDFANHILKRHSHSLLSMDSNHIPKLLIPDIINGAGPKTSGKKPVGS
jgi:hypothetical protein